MANKSKFDLDAYSFTVRALTEEDGGGFLCEFPDVQKCIGDGETPLEAVKEGREALKATLKTLDELNVPVPAPGSGGAASGQWRQRIPRSLHARLMERAAREGVSLNTLVTAMIAEGLGKRDRAA